MEMISHICLPRSAYTEQLFIIIKAVHIRNRKSLDYASIIVSIKVNKMYLDTSLDFDQHVKQ